MASHASSPLNSLRFQSAAKLRNIIAEFYGPSWWKKLSKESGSKILPCGDGSCWKAFKPIASLIPKGKLKSVNDTLTTELERYKEQVKVLKEGQNVDLKKESRNIDREIALEKKIKQLDNIVFKRDQSAQTVHMLTKPQFFYDHTTKQALGFQNPFYLKKAQQLEPKLYDGNVIKNTSAIVIPDSEETLMLAEESRSKMLLKQQDPMMLEKKVNTTPVDYANSVNSPEPTLSSRPTKVEVPKELPKVSMVNTSLKKLKYHLVGFDVVVKERTTPTAITEGSWEIFQRDNSVSNQSALSFDQLFEINELKAQSHEKDTVIKKLKEIIKSLSGKMNEDKIKKDLEEIETINIELDHRELLKHISKTCPSVNNTDGKLVAVTPKNKDKRVRFTEPVTSSGNTLLHDKPPDLSFSMYPVHSAIRQTIVRTWVSENLGKLQLKADIGIFIGYAPTKKVFRIYNRRTRRIIETIHVDFDELIAMASEHSSSGPALHEMTPATISSGLVPNPPPSTPFVPPSRID
ncbi:hypothetical protein Tco_0091490 [Tanacetum coccineum]